MLVTIMEVLDMTIVNVALPQMMGNLGATADQITWVLTAYIVSSAIIMPLNGLLVQRFGRRGLLLTCIVGFGITSACCGLATSLTPLVIFRLLQGVFGATLVPLSQYIISETFPEEERNKAFAIWGIGIMVAPVFGPSIGGYITEFFSWRAIFYLNIPVCILAFFMCMSSIPESTRTPVYVDKFGLLLLVLGIGCLQLFLDHGNEFDWLQSNLIIILMAVSFVGLGWFITRGLHNPKNLITMDLFYNRNFTVSTLILSLACMGMFGLMALQPLMLEQLMEYPVIFSGIIMGPRGVACALSMMFLGAAGNRINLIKATVYGLILLSLGCFLSTNFTINTPWQPIALAGAIQGFGMGLLFVPLSTLALVTLKPNQVAEAMGIFSFGRNIGGSVGIAILGTTLYRHTQINWQELASHVSSSGAAQWLSNSPLGNLATMKILSFEVQKQAAMIAFNNCHLLLAIIFLLLIPLTFLLKSPRADQAPIMAH